MNPCRMREAATLLRGLATWEDDPDDQRRMTFLADLLDAHASSVESSGPSSRAFVRLVTEMRDAQKAYFASRDGNALRRSMSLETEVDRALSLRDGVEHTLFEEGI